jgi:hypothetical protein
MNYLDDFTVCIARPDYWHQFMKHLYVLYGREGEGMATAAAAAAAAFDCR